MPAAEVYTVSQFVAALNQIIEYGLPYIRIEGEVSNYRVSQNKWVSFRIKDDQAMVECFMGVWQLSQPIENGMTVVVSGNPRYNGKFAKFSISTQRVVPSGAGAQGRARKLLIKKLAADGLLAADRKRALPDYPQKIGVISSETAAGLSDFVEVVRQRWPLMELIIESSAVQGETAPDNLQAALSSLNARDDLELIAIVRGGGAEEDLAAFDNEPLARAIAGSRLPVVIGVGHQRDQTIAELVADVSAATPTHAAELITPDASAVRHQLTGSAAAVRSAIAGLVQSTRQQLAQSQGRLAQKLSQLNSQLSDMQQHLLGATRQLIASGRQQLTARQSLLRSMSPQRQLERGYALVYDQQGRHTASAAELSAKQQVELRFHDGQRQAEVQ